MGQRKKYVGMDIMPDGRIRKRFTVDGQRMAAYGKTPQEAEANATKRRMEIMAGTYKKNDHITLGEYFHEWIERKIGTVSEKTIFDYERFFRVHIEPAAIARRKVQAIERREIVELQNKIAKGKTVKTANRVLLIVHAVLKGAVMDEIIVRNPATGIPRLKDNTRKPARETIHRALTREEIAAFMKEAKNTWYYNAYRLMLATGVRVGECCALEWGDVDYKNGVIHIRRTLTQNRKGDLIIGKTTKTENSKRDIPINAEINHILQEQRQFYNDFHGGKVQGIHARVFEDTKGGVIRSTTLNNCIRKIARNVNITYFTVHALRDTFATMAIIQGMQPNTLKEIMGHKAIGTTMDIYAHVLDGEKRKAMDELRIVT